MEGLLRSLSLAPYGHLEQQQTHATNRARLREARYAAAPPGSLVNLHRRTAVGCYLLNGRTSMLLQ